MALTEDRVNAKAGWCSMCISDMHSMCASDTCKCPDRRRHRGRPSFAGRDEATVTHIDRNPAPTTTTKRPKVEPVFRLAKEEPPEPPKKLSIAERITPLLNGIDSDEWYSVAQYGEHRGASIAAGKMRKAMPSWEWRSAGPKVYVRRATKKK